MRQLVLSFLGTYRVKLSGESVVGFQSDKARALLAYLAIESAQPHRRDRLAGLLWPDWPEANARANLRHALNNLRTILKDRETTPSFFLSDRQTIQLNSQSAYQLDVDDFNQHLKWLSQINSATERKDAIQHLQQAVSIYVGPFLDGFFLDDCSAFEEWALLTRERLQGQMIAALRLLVPHFEKDGIYDEALLYARRWVEIDALQEEAHRYLMRLLALDGQRSAALVQFETCRQLLADELGVAPSPETVDLHRQLQSGQLNREAKTKFSRPPRISEAQRYQELFPNSEQLGRYEILSEIGRGRWAVVYKARDTVLDRLVALKILQDPLLADENWVERFQQEARFIARLDHPRIITIHDVGQAKGQLYLVIRLVDGPSLAQIIDKQGRLTWAETIDILVALAQGLDYAHSQGILHRDIKLANILVDPNYGPLLSDFGLAKLIGENSLSQSGNVVGTPHYIAPELWDGQAATPQSDLYSLGCILYELLTGKKLFQGETPLAVMKAHFKPLILPDTWPEDVPPGLNNVLKTALSKEPGERYATANQMIKALIGLESSQSKSDEATPTLDKRHNLPAQTTRFIGRKAELAELQELLLRPEVRLLTLTGPGGSGKTRLALRLAEEVLGNFTDGVFFVSLAPIRDPELVVSVIAEMFDVRETGERPAVELLKEYLQDKHLLLVLDNFEHLVVAAPVVTDLLAAASGLKILGTSRAVLRLSGEHNYPVPPLALPDLEEVPSSDSLQEYEACQLFIDRAKASRADFSITDQNVSAVAEICSRLDGLPLAIELAAARVRLFTPSRIQAQLSSRLEFLTRGNRDLPARQQTLRNTIDWSYELLEPEEQILFRRLSVFVGGCSLEAVEAVGSVFGELGVLDALESLVDKSLLRQIEVVDELRFMMLETLREYGLERLRQSDEEAFTYQAYADYYTDWVEATTIVSKDDHPENWLAQLEREHANLRAVLRWARDHEKVETGLKLAGVMWWFWEARGYIGEGRRRLEEALSGSDGVPPALRAEAYTGAGTLAYWQGDYDQATAHHRAALALYREVGDEEGEAFALNNIGAQLNEQGDHDGAREFFEQCFALVRRLDKSQQLNNKRLLTAPIHNLAEVNRLQGDYEHALPHYEEVVATVRGWENKWYLARELTSLGVVHQYLGNYSLAAAAFNESLMISCEINNRECLAACFEGYAGLAAAQEQPARTARLLGAAEILREKIDVPIPSSERGDFDRNVALAYDALGETAFAAAWAAGRAMTLDETIDFAITKSG